MLVIRQRTEVPPPASFALIPGTSPARRPTRAVPLALGATVFAGTFAWAGPLLAAAMGILGTAAATILGSRRPAGMVERPGGGSIRLEKGLAHLPGHLLARQGPVILGSRELQQVTLRLERRGGESVPARLILTTSEGTIELAGATVGADLRDLGRSLHRHLRVPYLIQEAD